MWVDIIMIMVFALLAALSVQTNDKLQFLKDIVPKKVSAKDYIQQQSK